jgi:hypothetical protein
MTFRILILFILLGTKHGYGQDTTDASNLKSDLILTDSQNKKWLDSLKTLPLKNQLEFITQRVISDTNVFIRYGYADGLSVDYSQVKKTKFEGCCKPIIIIEPTYKVFNFDDKFGKPNLSNEIKKFKETLDAIIIETVKVLPENEATAIWGSNAANGAILLKVTDKRSIKFLKKQHNH